MTSAVTVGRARKRPLLPFTRNAGDPKPVFDKSTKYYPVGGRLFRSVTTITGDTIPKYLTGWAEDAGREVTMACLAKAIALRVPHDTMLAAVTALLPEMKEASKKKHAAGNIGTNVHDWVQWYCEGLVDVFTRDAPELNEQEQHCIDAWLPWAERVNLRPVFIEKVVWDVGTETGGTFDLIAYADFDFSRDELTLFDWKTGNSIWREAYAQLGAYYGMTNARGILRGREIDRGAIVRLPKSASDKSFDPAADVYHLDKAALEEHWAGFRQLTESWKYIKGKDRVGVDMTPEGGPRRARRKKKGGEKVGGPDGSGSQ